MKALVIDDDGQIERALAGAPIAVFVEQGTLGRHLREDRALSLIIGSKAENPMAIAQQMAGLDHQLAVLIVPARAQRAQLRQRRLLTPFLGDDVRILGEHTEQSLRAEVRSACQRTLSRRKHRDSLRLTVAPPVDLWRPQTDAFVDALMLQAPMGLVVLDPRGHIRAWNRYMEDLCGVSEAQCLGRAPIEVQHSQTMAPLMQILNKQLDAAEQTLELSGPESSVLRHLQLSQQELQGRNGELGRLVTVLDVSERVRAAKAQLDQERQHANAQRLESLGLLAGGIAHDFNNILVAIQGNAELGLLQTQPDMPVAENLHDILCAAQQAAELTRQMLAYVGRSPVAMQTRDLNTIVTDTQALMKASVAKNSRLHFELFERALPVSADLAQIRQVMLNLVTNASDALEGQQGVITVRTQLHGGSAELSVSDTGCGMSAETQRHIFEPFFTTKKLGRGLGLSAVTGIISAHNGELLIESELGLGSCIRVRLPSTAAAEPPSAGRDEDMNVTRPTAGTKVLVVDDEARVRRHAGKALRSLGYEVEMAEDGSRGLQKLVDGLKPDLVLLDYSMPGLSAEQFMRALQARAIRVPIVLCSGYADVDRSVLAQFENLSAFLGKPYSLKDLADKLAGALRP